MSENSLHQKLKEAFPEGVLAIHDQHGDETAIVSRDAFLGVIAFIKHDAEFDMNVLMDLTATDGLRMNWNPRFEIVYHFYSVQHNHRLRIKVRLNEKDLVMPTLVSVWPVADWFEREVWDMFGIRFEGRPNIKRLLMYEEFSGHPLRKDYPYNKRQPLIGAQN